MGLGKNVFVAGVAVAGISALFHLYLNRRMPGTDHHRAERGSMLNGYDHSYGLDATNWDGAASSKAKNASTGSEDNNEYSAESYFTITTDFLEWGWGDAIHMAPMNPKMNFKQSMNYWELWFANRIGITKDTKVADLGMGIGGPMRRIADFTGADISGVTICQYQIERAKALTPPHLKDKCHYNLGNYNFNKSTLPANSFDVVYFMESLSHSENRAGPLSEAFRLLKPGGTVGAWQWMLKPGFDHENEFHMETKRGMEYGGGLRNLNLPSERAKEFHKAGFETLLESHDMMDDAAKMGWTHWRIPIANGHDWFTYFHSSYFGRHLTTAFVTLLEFVGIAEPGTVNISNMMEHCGYMANEAGKIDVFTPLWLTIARKPETNQGIAQVITDDAGETQA